MSVLLPDDEFHVFIRDPRLGKQPHIPRSESGRLVIKRVLVKKRRCSECIGCKGDECGRCLNCVDKPKFGGTGVRKQICVHRRCRAPIIERSLV